tara:strand:+ start:893 stop:1393 length:501 start_codon:yes stop_codon:yes gene_type:complete
MCAGPVKNLYEDVTGITAAKDKAQNEFKEAQEKAKAAAEAEATRQAELEQKKQEVIAAAAADKANISQTLGGQLDDINTKNTGLMDQIVVNPGPTGPSPSELAARGAAQASQSVLNREKKKKKGALKIPYSPSKRKQGDRGPKSTKADLQIEGQSQSTGTGTNLAI